MASQRHVDTQLEDRVRNISSWRSELSAELDRNKNETNMMMNIKFGDINGQSRSIYEAVDGDKMKSFIHVATGDNVGGFNKQNSGLGLL